MVVVYDDSTATGCIGGEAVYQVSSSRDNLEEDYRGYESTGSELTFSDYYNNYIGIRFQNINIPQGATITEAYLEFTAYDTYRYSGDSMQIQDAANDAAEDL